MAGRKKAEDLREEGRQEVLGSLDQYMATSTMELVHELKKGMAELSSELRSMVSSEMNAARAAGPEQDTTFVFAGPYVGSDRMDGHARPESEESSFLVDCCSRLDVYIGNLRGSRNRLIHKLSALQGEIPVRDERVPEGRGSVMGMLQERIDVISGLDDDFTEIADIIDRL